MFEHSSRDNTPRLNRRFFIMGGTAALAAAMLDLRKEKAKAEEVQVEVPVTAEEAGELSSELIKTASFLIDSELFEELGFPELLASYHLEEAYTNNSLREKRNQTEHGTEQTVDMNIKGGNVTSRTDVQFSQIEGNGENAEVTSYGISFFMTADKHLAPENPDRSEVIFDKQELVQLIQELSVDKSIRPENVVVANGFAIATTIEGRWKMEYSVSPNGQVMAYAVAQ